MTLFKPCLAAALVVAFGGSAAALAQDFPTKPIRIIHPATAGTQPDILTRPFAAKLNERLGWTVLIEARPGGDFIPSTLAITQAPPDGHQVLLAVMSLTILPHTKKDLPYDLLKDLAPLVRIANIATALYVHPSVPAKTLPEVVAWSKANPGKLTFGGTGTGSSNHLTVELMKIVLGMNSTYVPYKDGAAMGVDLLEGRVLAGMNIISSWQGFVREGKMRPVVMFAATRNPGLPDTPTTMEVIGTNDLDVNSWYGFTIRSGTPRPIAERLERELLAVSQLPDIQEHIRKLGLDPLAEPSQPYRAKLESDYRKWQRVVNEARLTFN